MGIFDAVSALFHSERKLEEQTQKEEALRQAFKARCGHFKSLLSANKRALLAMSTLEEALKGERLFGMNFVRAQCTNVITNVFHMTRHLNSLSGNSYTELFDRLKDIQQRIGDIIAPKIASSDGAWVLPLEETRFAMANEVGAKMASLGEARRQLGLPIPRGFVITSAGYQRFCEANALKEEINRRIQMTDLSKLDAVFALSSSLQRLIIASPVPDDLAEQIMAHCRNLSSVKPDIRFAVRSSAIGEDAHGVSFAGQYRSDLNVSPESILDAFKEVVASKYGVTAMSYRVNRGIPDDEVPMCVGCLEMVEALAGGVVYSQDPVRGEPGIVVYAVPGLPKSVVDGSAEMDVFRVSREVPHRILERHVPHKSFRLQCAPGEGIIKKHLTGEEGDISSLTDEQVLEIVRIALAFEVLYGQAQDVEWAIDSQGQVVILQSRALPGMEGETQSAPLPEGVDALLEGGVCASSGVSVGPVFHVRRDADMLRFPRGAVLVIEKAHARWAPVLARASAIVSDLGGTAGHLASVAREYGVPALFGMGTAMEALPEGAVVTVDADSRRVFSGKVEEALKRRVKARGSFAGSPVHSLLSNVVKLIVPLHLLHPEAPEFSPAYCETLHDITRFCHEKAVEEMFRTDGLEDSLLRGRCGKQLKYKGSRLQYFIVNMGEGFCRPVEGKYVDLEQICCPPMHALWGGMLAIPWAGPPGTSARGFLSLVAESAGNPELEVTNASTRMARNYFLVDRDYCNLQASFGYHFCTVEAQAGDAEQENYVNFHFKGGAANLTRRLLRINAIADILAENGFIVELKEDALFARAEDATAEDVLDLLRILGYLLLHTRQMDASMQGEDSRRHFADALRKGIALVLKK